MKWKNGGKERNSKWFLCFVFGFRAQQFTWHSDGGWRHCCFLCRFRWCSFSTGNSRKKTNAQAQQRIRVRTHAHRFEDAARSFEGNIADFRMGCFAILLLCIRYRWWLLMLAEQIRHITCEMEVYSQRRFRVGFNFFVRHLLMSHCSVHIWTIDFGLRATPDSRSHCFRNPNHIQCYCYLYCI